MCEVYAQLLLSGLSSAVELSHTLLPSPPAGPMFACINSMHMTQSWPNFPLFYTKGSLEIARLRMCPFSEGASSGSGAGPLFRLWTLRQKTLSVTARVSRPTLLARRPESLGRWSSRQRIGLCPIPKVQLKVWCPDG